MADSETGRSRRGGAWLAAALLFALFAARAVLHAASTSATHDEPAHLVAGYSYWRWGDFRLNPEHPPLPKLLAALPWVLGDGWPARHRPGTPPPAGSPAVATWRDVETLWALAARDQDAQWPLARAVLYGMTDEALVRLHAPSAFVAPTDIALPAAAFLADVDWTLFAARLPTVVAALLLLGLVFAWARRLWGDAGGLLALALASSDPNLVAHGSLVTSDVPATLAIALVFFALARVAEAEGGPRRGWTALAALGVALAFATKLSAVLLPAMAVPALATLALARGGGGRRALRCAGALALGAVAALALLWTVYGFRFAAVDDPAAEPRPIATLLARAAAIDDLAARGVAPPSPVEVELAAREARPGLADRLVLATAERRLLPEAWLWGLAVARWEGASHPAFLAGEVSTRGFRRFFLATMLWKTPLVALFAIVAGLLVALRRPERRLEVAAFLLGPAAVFLVAASLAHFHVGHRHVLPIYPFLWVAAGALLAGSPRRPVVLGTVAAVVLGGWIVLAPPWRPRIVPPHELAYFNELAGGPEAGRELLADSNLDWGQDLPALAAWLRERGITEPIRLRYFGTADPRGHGIAYLPVRPEDVLAPPGAAPPLLATGGWLAVSETHLAGVYDPPELRAAWARVLAVAEPAGTAGRSIRVFRLPTPGAAAR